MLYWSSRRKGISKKLVRVIRSMYDGAMTTVRSRQGKTSAFEIKVGVHQGSCLSPLLFMIVMDAVSEYIQHDVQWNMLYADDLIIAAISSAKLQERFGEWQEALERKGLKVNADKTETIECARTAESLQITDKNGKALKQVKNFKYLGSVIHAQGGNEEDITARIAAAWKKMERAIRSVM